MLYWMMWNHCLNLSGRDNFERLNDVVNKVDSMISEDFVQAVERDDRANPDVVEYHRQLGILEKIYKDMETHSAKKKLGHVHIETAGVAVDNSEIGNS